MPLLRRRRGCRRQTLPLISDIVLAQADYSLADIRIVEVK